MDAWQALAVVGGVLFGVMGWLGSVIWGEMKRQQLQAFELSERVARLEAQHDAPPAAHSGPGTVPNPDRAP